MSCKVIDPAAAAITVPEVSSYLDKSAVEPVDAGGHQVGEFSCIEEITDGTSDDKSDKVEIRDELKIHKAKGVEQKVSKENFLQALKNKHREVQVLSKS